MAPFGPPPRARPSADAPKLIAFVPFDPATKMSEATVARSERRDATRS